MSYNNINPKGPNFYNYIPKYETKNKEKNYILCVKRTK